MRKAVRVAAVVAGLSLAAATQAAEPRLGTLAARSQPGEPVNARIPILDVETEQLAEFDVELAPSRVFARAGIDRQEDLSQLSFDIVTEADGTAYIEVTSAQPLDEPLLDFLVQVSWPQGEITREYTLLLDEPTTVAEARARRDAQLPQIDRDAVAAEQDEQQAAEQEPQQDSATPAEQAAQAEQEGPVRSAYGPVKRGDTLWSIAERYRPDDSVTMAQTMLAIQRLNPHAFADDNVNDLLSGWWLELPDKEEIQQLSAERAQATYEDQLAAWVPPAKRGAPAKQGKETPAPSPASDKAPPAESEREARLRIVALDEELGSEEVLALLDEELEPNEKNLSRLQGAVAALREERESLRAERDNLQARVTDLSERVEALERLVDLRMDEVLPPPQELIPTPRAPLPKIGMLEEQLPQPGAGVAAQPEPKPAPAPEPEPRPEPAAAEKGEAPWWASLLADIEELEIEPHEITAADLWQNDTLRQRALVALGLILVAISALTGLIAYRRRKQMEARQSSKKSFDPADFGLGQEEHQPSRRDPLDLAEDYIADDELHNARQVLERGSYREPQRADLRLKLLDVLASLDDRNGFLDQAQELYDRTRTDSDPVWQTALSIGRRFAPDSPLFGGLATAASGAAAGDDEDLYAEQGEGDDEDNSLDAKPDLEALDLGFDEEGDEADSRQEEGAAESAGDDFDRRLDEAFGSAAEEPEPAMQQEPEESEAAQQAADDLFGQEGEEEAESAYSELEEMDIEGLLSEEGDQEEQQGEAEQPAAAPEQPPDDIKSTEEEFAELMAAGEEGEPAAEPEQEAQATGEQPESAAESSGEQEAEDSSTGDEAEDGAEQEELGLGPGEGDQSDTMLDLARAYIDLGDESSAREMLQEVIDNGTDSQRDSAREIMSQLGG